MCIKDVNTEVTADKREWYRKTCCANPTYYNFDRKNYGNIIK